MQTQFKLLLATSEGPIEMHHTYFLMLLEPPITPLPKLINVSYGGNIQFAYSELLGLLCITMQMHEL
jgi:hypothetical protein